MHGQSLNSCSLAAFSINVDYDTLKPNVILGNIKLIWYLRQKPLNHGVFSYADDRIKRTRHPDICYVGGTAGQYTLIGGLHMCMRPKNSTDTTVKKPPHSFFLRSSLCMHIDNNCLRIFFHLFYFFFGRS